MTSLYDLLGARPDDDADALKKAYRNAVKAHHPDLHPDDPAALERFRQIAAAYARLSDAAQRAIYDRQLQCEREQLRLRLERQQLQRHERRQLRLKPMHAAIAITAVGVLVGGYRLHSPALTAANVASEDEHTATPVAAVNTGRQAAIVIKDEKQAVTAIETIRNYKQAATDGHAATAAEVSGNHEDAATAVGPVKADDNTPEASATAKADAVGSRTDVVGTPVERAVAQFVERPAGRDKPRGKEDGAEGPDEIIRPSTDPSTTDSGKALVVTEAEPVLAPLSNDANFYRERGIAAYRSGDFLGAIGNFDEAIRLNPADEQSYNFRGNVWDELGIFQRALADYDVAIRIDPNNPAVFHDRAILWQRRGELDKALIDLDRAIRFSFSDVHMYCDRGLVWYEKGRHDRAVADFDHALKLDPNAAAACIKRGLIVHRNGEFTLATLNQAIRVDQNIFDALRRANLRP